MDIEENKVRVYGGRITAPTQPLFGHNDHRIVMAMSVLCTLTGGIVEDAEAVNKSLPDFYERLSSLGIKVKKYEA